MSSEKKWKAAKKFVKADPTCRLLADAILAANRARKAEKEE